MYEVEPFSKENFQYSKGLAILAIIISHIGNFSAKTWFTPLGGIGVAIFLFCSGYGVMTSYYKKGLAHFWKNKFVSIWIPFALVEVVAAFVFKRSIIDVGLELIFIKVLFANGWYLQYLAGCYLIFYLGIRLVKNSKLRFLIWIVIAVLSFVFLDNLQGEQAFSFLGGLLIADINQSSKLSLDKRQMYLGGALVLLVALCAFAIRQIPWTREQSHCLYTFLNIFFKGGFAAAIIAFSTLCKPFKKILTWIGDVSYSLYLVHGYFLFIVANQLIVNFYVSSVVVLVISFVLAIVLNELVKRLRKRKV